MPLNTQNWLRQHSDSPLFPDILWSRPETKLGAGKILIIGGNSFGFAATALAYSESVKAGVGSARVLLPESLRKTVGAHLQEADFAMNNPSGSFAKTALQQFLSYANWGEGVLLAGDFGRNSETSVLLESFCKKYTGPLTVTQDALEYFLAEPRYVVERPLTTLVASYEQLQKIALHLKYAKPLLFNMDASRTVEWLQEYSGAFTSPVFITSHLDQVFVARGGRVATQASNDDKTWRVKTAAHGAVYWLQNPGKQFEAIVTSLLPETR